MKVTRNTPDQLILEETPWGLGIALVAMTVIFVGLGLLLVSAGAGIGGWFVAIFGGGMWLVGLIGFTERVQVILDRTTNRASLRRLTLLRYTQVSLDLSDVTRARIETKEGASGRVLERAALVVHSGPDAGTHPVMPSYTNGKGPGRTAAEINAWLRQARASNDPDVTRPV